jgi:hypothetical protein
MKLARIRVVDGVAVSPLGVREDKTVQPSGFGVFEVGQE